MACSEISERRGTLSRPWIHGRGHEPGDVAARIHMKWRASWTTISVRIRLSSTPPGSSKVQAVIPREAAQFCAKGRGEPVPLRTSCNL
mgnify:CR=1 FL=1